MKNEPEKLNDLFKVLQKAIDDLNALRKELVNERIELRGVNECMGQYTEIQVVPYSQVDCNQIKLMEQAINGELFTKEDMKKFTTAYIIDKSVFPDLQLDKYLEKWLKDR